jgi:PTS system mannose-specific IID component
VTLSRSTRLHVFVRSLFIQAGYNSEGMQSLGLVYALAPALEELYPEPISRTTAFQRHLAPFNTHPYVAAAIIGGILFHEERIAKGEEPESQVNSFKRALSGPLAALGDGFFWLSWRPAVGALSVATVPLLGAYSALLFLVLYNLVHLTLRWRLFVWGLRKGEGMLEPLAKLKGPSWAERLRRVAAASAGGLAALLALQFGAQQHGAGAPLLAGGCLSLGLGSYLLVANGRSPYWGLYLAALFAGATGVLL